MVVLTSVNTYEELTKLYFTTAEQFRQSFQTEDTDSVGELSEQLTLLPQCHVLTVEIEAP